jgi:hypothetical protein
MSSSPALPSRIDASERTRRIQTVVHTALFAGVGIYAVLLLFLRTEIAAVASPQPPGTMLFLVLAGLGAAQYGVASAVGRATLLARRSCPLDRVRVSFLLRGAAEAIALGLVLGFGGRADVAAPALGRWRCCLRPRKSAWGGAGAGRRADDGGSRRRHPKLPPRVGYRPGSCGPAEGSECLFDIKARSVVRRPVVR